MASACEIVLAGLDRRTAAAISRRCEDEVRRIEQKYSRYRDDSLTARINAAAERGSWADIDTETFFLLDFAGKLHAWSQGRFDLTSGVLRELWRFDRPALPSPEALASVRARIGWQHVRLEPGRIGFGRAGMALDFGAIGKEYAADRAALLAREAGTQHGFVNLGGDLCVIGPPPDAQAWSIGIRHPRREHETIANISLVQGALATSGDYERYFKLKGKRYCHILDARTGMPVSYWQSVSVLSSNCLAAGALATLAMLFEEDAPAFLMQQGVRFLAVDSEGRLWTETAQPDAEAAPISAARTPGA